MAYGPPLNEERLTRQESIPKRELTPEEFEEMFGFALSKPLSVDELGKCHSINRLFNYMQDTLNQGSWQIFTAVFGETEVAAPYHSAFLHDVRTCPLPVIAYCRKALGFDEQTEKC